MAKKLSNSCLYCKKVITGRQLALGCSVCCRWQHRKCNMGIDIVVYRVMVQGTVPWKCLDCRPAPKEPEDMDQKELFLNYFSLGRSVNLVDSIDKNDFLLNGPDLDDACHNSMLQEEGFSKLSVHESFKADDIVSEIISNIPWLPRIETVYSEAWTQDDESIKLQNNMDEEPSLTIPWFPKIVSVYSIDSSEDINFPVVEADPVYKTCLSIDSVYSIASSEDIKCTVVEADPVYKTCLPIDSVYSIASLDDIKFPVVEFDPVYKTYLPIENCPTCHKVLVPVQFTVNVVTAIMKTTCQCGLYIEIDLRSTYFTTATVQKKRKRSETNTTVVCQNPDIDTEPFTFKAPVTSTIQRRKVGDQTTSNMAVIGSKVRYSCYLCSKTCLTSRGLKLHLHSHRSQQNNMQSSSRVSQTKVEVNLEDNRQRFVQKTHTCSLCERGFKGRQDLVVHIVTQACTRSDRFLRRVTNGWECTSCDKLFGSRNQAECHTRTHTSGRRINCPVCHKDFTGCKGNILVKHVKELHPEYFVNLGC